MASLTEGADKDHPSPLDKAPSDTPSLDSGSPDPYNPP